MTPSLDIIYLISDFLLILLNSILVQKMSMSERCFPIIFFACFASLHIALADLQAYYNWFGWDIGGVFTYRILIYKLIIVAGLVITLIRGERKSK